MTWTPDVCIFHFPCHDGFMSSVIAKRRWPECQMLPTNYGKEPPAIPMNCNILVADFSYPPDVLRSFKAKSIVVLDHHKTAEAQLKEFTFTDKRAFTAEEIEILLGAIDQTILASFDMARSGAVMTWDFCYPMFHIPVLVKFIQDRDIWTKLYPETGAVHLLLESYGYDYEKWEELIINFESGMGTYIAQAEAIERYYRRQVEEMAKQAAMGLIAGHMVPVAYVPYTFVSDVCAEMLRLYPEVDFAAACVKSFGETTYSLRSEDRRADVSEIAKRYGGGGHRNAAGFRMP